MVDLQHQGAGEVVVLVQAAVQVVVQVVAQVVVRVATLALGVLRFVPPTKDVLLEVIKGKQLARVAGLCTQQLGIAGNNSLLLPTNYTT